MINRCIALNIPLTIFSMCLHGVSTEEFKNAVENGEIEKVRQMLNRQSCLLQSIFNDTGEHAMHVAARHGHIGIVLLLKMHGVSYDQRDNHQETALHKAARNGHYDLVQHLLSQESSFMSLRDAQGATPLYRAVEHGHSAIVSLLLDAGAVVTVGDGMTNVTMLEMAAQNGYAEIFGKLFNVIGCLIVRNSPALSALFFHAIRGGSEEIVRFLIGRGADVNGTDTITRTPLHVAAIFEHTQLVRLLLERGARADTPDEHGRKALDIALRSRQNSMVQLLREASSDETPAHNVSAERETRSQRLRRLFDCFRLRR